MNEEEKRQFNSLMEKVKNLEQENKKLRANSTIPYSVEQAFRVRLGDLGDDELAVSTKGANSENQAVNEGGLATYDVLGDPVGFLEVDLGGTVYYLPYYNA